MNSVKTNPRRASRNGKVSKPSRSSSIRKKKQVRKYYDEYLNYGFSCTEIDGVVRPVCVICQKTFGHDAMRRDKIKTHLSQFHAELLNKPRKYFESQLKLYEKQNEVAPLVNDVLEVLLKTENDEDQDPISQNENDDNNDEDMQSQNNDEDQTSDNNQDDQTSDNNQEDLTSDNNQEDQPSFKEEDLTMPSENNEQDENLMTTDTKRVLVGCSGSVAAMKLPELCSKLTEQGCDVKVVVTDNAGHFFKKTDVQVPIFNDEEEWDAWTARGDPVLHIELAQWADIFVVAPLDANTMAKFANGLADNLLTCAARAWDLEKPFIFCPAMNTKMYEHPITRTHRKTLKCWGYREIPAITKTLICGDTGIGAMAEVDTIVENVMLHFN